MFMSFHSIVVVHGAFSFVAAVFVVNKRMFSITVAAVVLILTGGMVYSVLEGWSYVDSVYVAAQVVTTVGYGDVPPRTVAGRLFTVVFALVGASLFMTASHMWTPRQRSALMFNAAVVVIINALVHVFFDGTSLGEGLYSAVVTSVTIGFGDFVSKSAQGKLCLALCMCISVGPMAGIVGELGLAWSRLLGAPPPPAFMVSDRDKFA
jgi:hypothetical protein